MSKSVLLKIYIFIYFILFIYFWLCWVFVAARAFLWLWQVGATLCCGVQASHCGDFSCCRAQALGAWVSVVVAHRLSCSVACGIFLDQGSNSCHLHQQADSYHCTTREVPGPFKKNLFFLSGSCLRNTWLPNSYKGFSPMFSSRTFIVLGFTFRYIFHFELIFCV